MALRRLYHPDDSNNHNPSAGEPCLIAPDGRVRAMVLELARPADWSVLSAVWQGVQADLAVSTPTLLRASSTEKSAEPKQFLLAVMTDPGVAMQLRIEAAKALLPYC